MLPAAEERTPALTSGEETFSLAAGVALAALETHQGPHAAQGKKTHQGIFSKNRALRVGEIWVKWSGTHQDRKCSWSKTVSGSALDANGNTLSDPSGKSYTWDFENRLVQVVNPGVGTTTFRYDPLGRRIQKSGPLGTSNYLYDIYSLIETTDASGTWVARYTQGRNVDEPLAAGDTSGTSYYYQGDDLGSITSLSSSAGAISSTYVYDGFGNVSSSTGTVKNPFQFAAREFDQETNLYYNRARYYNPNSGRFASEDPIHFKGGINFYPYARNNPAVYVDPYGESAWCPSWVYGCPDYFHKKELENNLENDQEILNMTGMLALDPFCYGKPGVEQLVEIWQLERLNTIIDAIELGNSALSALDEIPGVDIPNSFDYDQEMEWLASLRERNNRQIDELLQEAAEALERARERRCPRCSVR